MTRICPDCEDNELLPEQTICSECEADIKYLDKFIKQETALKGRFCRECSKPVGKGKQLCDLCGGNNKTEYFRKYAKDHKTTRAEYWKNYVKKEKLELEKII